jgi:hypothetical protein
MFAITGAELARAVLDSPGGGSSFTIRASAAGVAALAADPVYARPVKPMGRLAVAETRRAVRLRGRYRPLRLGFLPLRSGVPRPRSSPATSSPIRVGTYRLPCRSCHWPMTGSILC